MKCPFCGNNHTNPQNRVKLLLECSRQGDRYVMTISGGFQCIKNKSNKPLVIELNKALLNTKSNWVYDGVLKPTFNQRYVSNALPGKLRPKTIYIVSSDMNSGKSEWTDMILKDEQGGCLLAVRKSQTKGFVNKYKGFLSY